MQHWKEKGGEIMLFFYNEAAVFILTKATEPEV